MNRGPGNALRLRYIYGPVPSWRVGSSLGIDLLSQRKKICTYDCLYCQLGKTREYSDSRQLWVSERQILKELMLLPKDLAVDYITLAGRGEPTLAANLGAIVNLLRKVRKEPVAVITNASLMYRSDVRDELSNADLVIAKLDAHEQELFMAINQPFFPLRLETVVGGILEFRKQFRGKLALQVMFTEENIAYAREIAAIAANIAPDEVQINTPLRPCAIKPIDRERLSGIENLFHGLQAISVYKSRKTNVTPISDEDTLKRRGKA